MKIALPVTDNQLCMHFGHCEKFAVYEVDDKTKTISSHDYLVPPPHEPGLLPVWLAGKGVNCIIAGGMGSRAQQLFNEKNIKVITGAPSNEPKKAVEEFLNDKLTTGPNVCDH